MTASKKHDSKLEKLCSAAIAQRLGDISELPRELVQYVFKVYREFIAGYLNILRQKENKPLDWIPETLVIDSELTDGMRHFFSDYQHITKEYYLLNERLDRLREIDKHSQGKLYRHIIDDILNRVNSQVDPGGENE
jgi:hypothetical protein